MTDKIKIYDYSKMTCPYCNHINKIVLTEEEYANDYDFNCDNCNKDFAVSECDYEPVLKTIIN